jgi:hypothetical protein
MRTDMSKLNNSSLFENLVNVLTRENFLHLVQEDSIKIEEAKNKGSEGKLIEIIIKNIPYNKDSINIWQFNLEKEVKGISPIANSRTVETALAYFNDSLLTVFLIEMKSSIQEKNNKHSLSELIGKIEDSISRFYFLLLFFLYSPSILREKGIDFDKFKNSKTKFKGIVFYNKSKLEHIDESERIYKVFKGEESLIECEPVLGRQKIPLKFYQNTGDNKESFEINFGELLKI